MEGMSNHDAAATFDPLRPKLIRIAYRMLGSVADADRGWAFVWPASSRRLSAEPVVLVHTVETR